MPDIKDNLKDDDTAKDKPYEQPSLDEVHDRALEDIDNDDTADDATDDAADDKADDTPVDKPDDKADEPVLPDVPDFKPEPKVQIKDYEGNVHEFDKIEDVPDDFEPASYKEWGVAVQNFVHKDAAERKQLDAIEKTKADKERIERINEIKAEWDKEVVALTADKRLPEDAKERAKVIDSVYNLMGEENKQGRQIDSFTHAYEIYNYRQGLKQQDDDRQKAIDIKKSKGSMVMSSGSGVSGEAKPKQGRVIEAPPTGISLDAIHENVLGSL
jgi:hypothetical protein